jgi:hypothetical protein
MQRCAGLDRYVSFLRQALDFTKSGGATGGLPPPVMSDAMDDHTVNGSGQPEQVFADIDIATRRLMAALDALERAVERRRDADRDEDELAARIQALGADRARLADELDGSLVRSKRLERSNRLDAAIGTIREVLDAGELS